MALKERNLIPTFVRRALLRLRTNACNLYVNNPFAKDG